MTYLPLTNNPEESFIISIFGNLYNFRQIWNEYGFWTLDIHDADGNVLIYGVKIITQEYLLKQYPDILFDLYSQAASDPTRLALSSFQLEVSNKDV
jgi:hypothetical protein